MIKIPALQPSLRAWLLEGPLSAHWDSPNIAVSGQLRHLETGGKAGKHSVHETNRWKLCSGQVISDSLIDFFDVCIFRFIVTADSGIVTSDSGHRDRGVNHRFRHRDRRFR